jgi:hypothetical protein
MNKKGIAFQLGIYVLAAVTVVIAMIVLLNYGHSRKIIMENIEESAIHQSSVITNRISLNILNNQEVVRNVASQVLYYHSRGDLLFFMEHAIKGNKILGGLHVVLSPISSEKLRSTVIMNTVRYANIPKLPINAFGKKEASGPILFIVPPIPVC